jgi:hypothetical protein
MQAAGGFLGRQVPCGQIGVGDRIEPQRQIARRCIGGVVIDLGPADRAFGVVKDNQGTMLSHGLKVSCGPAMASGATPQPAPRTIRSPGPAPQGRRGATAIGGDRGTDIHDYPAKALLHDHAAPVSDGRAVLRPEEARMAAGALAGR